jgi:two-component system chemotaxis sensor kinase CheA/two-component system chemotaxis response regulator CheY
LKSSSDQNEAGPHRCARILHAESDALAAWYVASFLTAKGHQIETVTNGRDAVAKVVTRPGFYDLLIADHLMPELTGLECVCMLRGMGYPGKIIVFASPLPPDVEERIREAGVDRILNKADDLTLMSLYDVIQELLGAPTVNENRNI